MIYLEMSRDETHGGGAWGFTNCVWAPTETRNGGSWPFWEKVRQVREGDIIIHLRGVRPNAHFVGYSTASGDGFRSTRRPPDPGEWDYASSFYRADLSSFTQFHQPINLDDIFASRNVQLEDYFDSNRNRGEERANIFFVRQRERLQCLNGAYLSAVDEDLLTALFGADGEIRASETGNIVVTVETGSQILAVRSRLGQSRFSQEIKRIYGHQCCFPGCPVADTRFLIGSHIARWSDNEELRGHLGNGLCLCVLHDKAFELGIYTLDENHRVFINPRERESNSQVVQALRPQHGEQIRLAEVLPLDDALLEHWIRVDIDTMS